MPRVVTCAVVDDEHLAEVLAPRSGVVVERAAVGADRADGAHGESSLETPGAGRPPAAVFEAAVGPVDGYRRTVEIEPVDGGTSVRQTVEYRLAIPLWGWLFAIPYRRQIARLTGGSRVPWWAPPDAIDPRAAATLAALAALAAVGVYPSILLTQSIEFAREEMGFSKPAQSVALAAVRADVVVALVVVGIADRQGRRRLTLVSLAAGCGLTAAGALSPNVVVLAATQVLARGFLTAAGILVGIYAAEEMPAGSRAYAVSLLAAAGALGAGVALAVFPLADLNVRGWRLPFALAAVGIPLVRVFGRHLPESRRFRAPHPEARLRSHGRRFWLLAASGFLFAVFWGPATQYQTVFLRDERGFSAARISLFTAGTNVWGGLGIVAGGRLADVRGRRVVAAVGIVGGVGATVVMFFSAGWTVWAWSVVASIIGAATVPALSVYGPELFPTAARARANGLISGVSRAGSVLGLLVLALVIDRQSSLAPIMALLATGPAAVVVLILAAYPETAHRELEELNPEDAVGVGGLPGPPLAGGPGR